jgi:hypothetical protein
MRERWRKVEEGAGAACEEERERMDDADEWGGEGERRSRRDDTC